MTRETSEAQEDSIKAYSLTGQWCCPQLS